MSKVTNILVISDFNAELVSRYACVDRSLPICRASTAPYGQVFQTLADFPDDKDVAAFIWTRPEGVIPEYLKIVAGEKASVDRLIDDVDAFAGAIANLAAKSRPVLIASWVATEIGRAFGMMDWTTDGQASSLARMNLRLSDKLAGIPGLFILDSQRWLDSARPPRDSKYWFSAKCPFSESVCQAVVRDIKAALRGLQGLARKLIVLDLDNTLWGGIAGEDGWKALRLGGHDPVGEAYVNFQRGLKALSRRGIALAVVSKNEEATAIEVFDRHSEMVLRRSDLVGWRINWRDKAQNIVELARELNLGLESIVFIDDEPGERGRVGEALPDLLVPEWPKDPARFGETLRELDCFDQPAITVEDRSRTSMYAQQRERNESLMLSSSTDEWLRSLAIRVEVKRLGEDNLKRAIQLLNKTNQMNLQTRRLTETEMTAWLVGRHGRELLTFKIGDRFGDLGLTGLLGWEPQGKTLEITDFVLSCRAMGRHVEALMAHLAVEAARAAKLLSVAARLVPTARNLPCREFWLKSGFAQSRPDTFTWEVAQPYPKPEFIALTFSEGMDLVHGLYRYV